MDDAVHACMWYSMWPWLLSVFNELFNVRNMHVTDATCNLAYFCINDSFLSTDKNIHKNEALVAILDFTGFVIWGLGNYKFCITQLFNEYKSSFNEYIEDC